MSATTCGRSAAAALFVAARLLARGLPDHAFRLELMQRDMDHLAAGRLPIPPNGRNATASEVEDYLRSQRQSVRAA